jgi:myo-inositol-1(or 4)-monophosphatase
MEIKIEKDVIGLVKEVGEFIRKERESFTYDAVELKSFNNLVSYVDKQAESKLIEGLGKLVPEAGFLAEEGTVQQSESQWQWIIDPLDGTTNFVHNIPAYSISVALAFEEDVYLGVVYEVTRKECFYAIKDKGAFLDGKPIRISTRKLLEESLIATGFPYHDFGKTRIYFDILEEMMRKTQGVRRIGSAALDLAYTACGRFEAFFEYNLNPWDVAAGALLVKEAGGTVSDFSGGNGFLFGREIIAGGNVYPLILEIIKHKWN